MNHAKFDIVNCVELVISRRISLAGITKRQVAGLISIVDSIEIFEFQILSSIEFPTNLNIDSKRRQKQSRRLFASSKHETFTSA